MEEELRLQLSDDGVDARPRRPGQRAETGGDDLPCAVISRTAHDLPAHRRAAFDACLRQDFFPKMMEDLAQSPADPVQLSRDLVDQADVYVPILGFRYGTSAPGHDKSFTHLELDRAKERGLPEVVLLMDEHHRQAGRALDGGAVAWTRLAAVARRDRIAARPTLAGGAGAPDRQYPGRCGVFRTERFRALAEPGGDGVPTRVR